jgi:hypothetical protein
MGLKIKKRGKPEAAKASTEAWPAKYHASHPQCPEALPITKAAQSPAEGSSSPNSTPKQDAHDAGWEVQ